MNASRMKHTTVTRTWLWACSFKHWAIVICVYNFLSFSSNPGRNLAPRYPISSTIFLNSCWPNFFYFGHKKDFWNRFKKLRYLLKKDLEEKSPIWNSQEFLPKICYILLFFKMLQRLLRAKSNLVLDLNFDKFQGSVKHKALFLLNFKVVKLGWLHLTSYSGKNCLVRLMGRFYMNLLISICRVLTLCKTSEKSRKHNQDQKKWHIRQKCYYNSALFAIHNAGFQTSLQQYNKWEHL